MFESTIGQKLKNLRVAEGITQKNLAKELNIKQDDISRYENDKQTLNLELLKLYCKRYNVSADYLLGLSPCSMADKDERYIFEKTGLENDAISLLSAIVPNWINESLPRASLEIYNRFVSLGKFTQLVEVMIDYYEELKSVTNHIESAVCTLTEELNECEDTQICDVFPLSSFNRELNLYMYEAQNIANDFMRQFAEQEFKEYNVAINKLNQANKRNMEHNNQVKEKELRASEQDGNNPKA